jgi:hypothetical protein
MPARDNEIYLENFPVAFGQERQRRSFRGQSLSDVGAGSRGTLVWPELRAVAGADDKAGADGAYCIGMVKVSGRLLAELDALSSQGVHGQP